MKQTALFCAVQSTQIEIVKYFYKKNKDMFNATWKNNGKDESFLTLAARNNHVEIIKFFIENDIKINGKQSTKIIQDYAQSHKDDLIKIEEERFNTLKEIGQAPSQSDLDQRKNAIENNHKKFVDAIISFSDAIKLNEITLKVN